MFAPIANGWISSAARTYSRNEPLGPLSIVHSIGRDGAHFALGHQLPLSG